MKAKDEVGKNTINMARAAIKQYEIDNHEEIDETGIIAIISKQVSSISAMASSPVSHSDTSSQRFFMRRLGRIR